MKDVAELLLAGVAAFEQHAQVKHNALIDAAVGNAAVQLLRRDEGRVPGAQREGLAVQRQLERSLQHMQQLVLLMPVVGHLVPRMSLAQIVVFQGKTHGAPLAGLMIAQGLHQRRLPDAKGEDCAT